jgi:16S rRNA (adenine1518-N6/adenine1519-N6)-dimethyltransferase
VVLEIGGGEGVLSAYLAPRVSWVHVVELDERLRGALERSVAGFENVALWWGDAMKLDLGAMEPRPTKVVANLPYGIAAGMVLRTIEELESVRLWVVMVQREVGERLAAPPGSGAYGVSSVLAQLAGEVRVVRAVPRAVFRPVPNVDSALVRIARTGAAPSPQVRRLVGAAFAHRRKALARSLVLSGVGRTREQIREALVGLGHPADERAERLAPREFVALAEALGL